MKVIAVSKIKINVVIGGKELILKIYNVALIPGAIISLLSEDQLKRKGVKIIKNKLIMRQEIIIEWDPYYNLKLIRIINMKPYIDI